MRADSCNREVYKKIAKKHGISEEMVEEVARTQGHAAAETITEGKWKTIWLPFLGRFLPREHRLKKLKENE